MSSHRVALYALGGTISCVGTHRLDLVEYSETGRRLSAETLLQRLPELRALASIRDQSLRSVGSSAIGPKDWVELAEAIKRVTDSGSADCIVVTHGTGTLEETAYFLEMTVGGTIPIVVTGAMRPSSAVSPDGDLNLIDAIRVATSDEARRLGVLVVMNSEIHAAVEVTKRATARADAFASPGYGPLGYVEPDGLVLVGRRPVERHMRFEINPGIELPRVDIVASYAGADGTLIDALVQVGVRGLVSCGIGSGRATPSENEALDRAIEHGVAVCQSSRVGSGRVVRTAAMKRRGIVAAGRLSPWKARVLLSLALTVTQDREAIQGHFASN